MPEIVLKNGSYIDVIEGKMVFGRAIVIENGKISGIRDNDDHTSGENVEIIDVNGKTIIPGLIDCHVHLGGTAKLHRTEDFFTKYQTDYYSYIGLVNAQEHLKSGFTTLRDMGSRQPYPASLRDAFAQNLIPGPRLVVAQTPLWQFGNQEVMGPWDYFETLMEESGTISGRDGVIHAVRDRKARGANYIKTPVTGGVLHGSESNLDRVLWRREELGVMVDEAHRLGMHLAVHAHGGAGIAMAVDVDVDTVDHCSMISEETADEMAKKDIYMVPTHRAHAGLMVPETLKEMSKPVQDKVAYVGKKAITHHQMAFQKGVKIAVGTDSGTPTNPHGTTAKEITLMVKNIGMTPIMALQAATINAALAIKVSKITGSIQENKAADLVVVDGNPLDDIRILEKRENLELVIKSGIIMVKKGSLLQN